MSSKGLKGFLQLSACVVFIWWFFWIFTPWWVSFSPTHQSFGKAADENDIPVGALYYSDIDLSDDAERHLRNVWLNRKKVQAKKEAAEAAGTLSTTN